jgi:predicted GIY-YIG superfamily endonuclease
MKGVYIIAYLLYICFMKTHTVYALVNPTNNKPFYVGETVNLSKRLSNHLSCDKTESKEKNDYIKALLQNGVKPKVEVLSYNIETKEKAVEIETYYIGLYRKLGFELFNKNNGGNKPPLQIGKKTIEQKRKYVIVSPLKKAVIQYTKKMEFVNEFIGVREASRITKIDHRSISQVAAGSKIRKTAGGFKWQYKQ